MQITEFQLALIGTGVVAVLGVWAYNAWQEYRQRKMAEKVFRGAQEDVLIEPADESLDTPAFVRAAESRSAERIEPHGESRIEPVITLPQDEVIAEPAVVPEPEADVEEQPAPSASAPPTPGEDCLDAMIELGLALPPEQDVAALHAAWGKAKVAFGKRIRWIGRNAGAETWAEIDDPARSGASHAYVTLQLADRQGAVDKGELSAFCFTAEEIATAYGMRTDAPALDEIMAHARAIDDLCASVDIQIAIHIVGRGGQAFAGTKLRGLLEASGLQWAPDGLFYLLDNDGRRLFSVCNSGAVPFDLELMRSGSIADVTFWLDVPRVADGGRVFDTMLATARQLAEALDGVLVDEQRNPLADKVLAGIRAKVVELQTQMAAHGIPAGGRRALRLFV